MTTFCQQIAKKFFKTSYDEILKNKYYKLSIFGRMNFFIEEFLFEIKKLSKDEIFKRYKTLFSE